MADNKERKRAPNWSQAESLQLLEEVLARHAIIKGHHRNLANAEQCKQAAYEEIAANVSAVSSYVRTGADCKTKYTNIMKDASYSGFTLSRNTRSRRILRFTSLF